MSRLKTTLMLAPTALILLTAVLGPWLAPHPVDQPIGMPYAGPSRAAPLGTDILGCDILSQMLQGGWGLILIALIIAIIVTSLAAVLGSIASLRPRAGGIVEFFADMFILLPPVLGILVIMLSWPQSREFGLVLIAAVLGTPYSARVFTAACAGVAASGYVQVASASGEKLPYLVFREVLPNLRSTLLTQFALRFVAAMYLVSTAAFLQLSTTLGQANWGVMVRDNSSGIVLNSWAVVAPSLAIGAVAISVGLAVAVIEGGRRGVDGAR